LVAESIFDSGELQPLLGAQSQVKLVLSRLGRDHEVFYTFAVEIHLLDYLNTISADTSEDY
jgi:hypothetical protein